MSGRSIDYHRRAVRASEAARGGIAWRRTAQRLGRYAWREFTARCAARTPRARSLPRIRRMRIPAPCSRTRAAPSPCTFGWPPQHETGVRRAVAATAAPLGQRYQIQEGNMVLEIKPQGSPRRPPSRPSCREPPFSGRSPVFVGDDLTDRGRLRCRRERMGGISIAVGDRISGQWRLENPRRCAAGSRQSPRCTIRTASEARRVLNQPRV